MAKINKIILNGLKMLEDLETKYGIFQPNNSYDERDSEFDQIIISDVDDPFNQKEIPISIIYNSSLFEKFPNALLMADSIFGSEIKDDTANKHTEVKMETTEDIWQILDQIKKDSTAEKNAAVENTDMENVEIICKGCSSKNTLIEDQHASLIVCSECGFVNEELFDLGPEWRQYNNDDNRGEGVNRCGCPSNFFFPKSSQGTIMTGSSNNRLKRKQKWNSTVYKERSLNQVFEFISYICSKNNIPKIIVDTAKILYKKISDCKFKSKNNIEKQIIIRGENRISIIAATVQKSCEINKSPRSVKEVAAYFGIEEKKLTKGKKQLDKFMKYTGDDATIFNQLKSNIPEDYIRRYSNDLKKMDKKIDKSDIDIAVKIAHNCCKMKLASDHNPQSIAAGSVLLMVNYFSLDVEKKRISKLFGTSDVTISKIYHKIEPYMEALVDDDATNYIIEKFKING